MNNKFHNIPNIGSGDWWFKKVLYYLYNSIDTYVRCKVDVRSVRLIR